MLCNIVADGVQEHFLLRFAQVNAELLERDNGRI